MTTKFLVTGASIPAGAGLPLGKDNSDLWITKYITQVHDVTSDTITNLSHIGDSNHEIFCITAHALAKESYSDVYVCWQTAPRNNTYLGLELYPTRAALNAPEVCNPIGLVGEQTISGKILNQIRETFLRYYNYHWDYCDLVSYINILIDIAESKKSKIHFLTWYQAWDQIRYFDKIDYTYPSELDEFTKEILNWDMRSDGDIRKLYDKIHNDYAERGGIREEHWLNLYNPLRAGQVDSATEDDGHPGIISQKNITDLLLSLTKK